MHSVVLLFGDEVVPVEVLGLSPVGSPAATASTLRARSALKSPASPMRAGCAARRSWLISASAAKRFAPASTAAAAHSGGAALIESALLDEVTALVEWPVPIVGRFEQRFLSLPREVVIATIQDHQRYFAIEGADGKLTGGFVTVSNIESRDPDKVREGNERVVRPRLSDAAFFWEQDRKIPLEAHAATSAG